MAVEESLLSGEPILRPTVDVQLSNAGLTIATKALIDTGAPRCVFPRGVGELIGVSIPRYPSESDKTITLMGKDWPAITEEVELLHRRAGRRVRRAPTARGHR